MCGTKLTGRSGLLGRDFHADGFLAGPAPRFVALMFGGSGVDEATYRARTGTLVPVFDAALARLEREASFAFVYVTAPWEVPFARFDEEPVESARWTRHVREEVLPLVDAWLGPTGPLPRYLMGYSGGAALALSGHHLDAACYGAGMLGADGLPKRFVRNPGWPEPLTLYYNLDDRVFDTARPTVEALVAAGAAEHFRRLPGGHGLADYVANESFGGLIRRAARTGPDGGG